MKYFLTAMIFLFSSILANAESIYMGGWSAHTNETKGYNERNDLIALEVKGYVVGTLKNSFNDRTFLATKRFTLSEHEYVTFRGHVGATYGYKRCNSGAEEYYQDDPDKEHYGHWVIAEEQEGKPKVCPAWALEVSFGKFALQPSILYMGNAALATFKFEF